MLNKVNSNAKKTENDHNATYLQPLLYLLSLLFLPIAILLGICFVILRQILDSILRLRHKNNYAGLLCSADAVWAAEDESRSIVHGLFAINYHGHGNFYEETSALINAKFNMIPKLLYTKKEFFGYYYFVKNQVVVSECIKKIDNEVCTEEDLKEFLSKKCNSPLVNDNTALWECYISTKGIKWHNHKDPLHVIIFRFHHTVGDGWSILNTIQKEIFGATKPHEWIKKQPESPNKAFKFDFNRFIHIFVEMFSTTVDAMKLALKAPLRLSQVLYLNPDDKNELHGKPLCGEKITVWSNETSVELLPICKEIRNQLGVRFTDIISTVVGGSLHDYFKRNNFEIPQYVSSVVPVLILPKRKSPDQEVVLSNNISISFLVVPVDVEEYSMLNLLKESVKQGNISNGHSDGQINNLLLNYIAGLLPLPLLRIVLNNNKMSIAISNLPGIPNLTTLDGSKLEDVALYPPHRGTTGVTFGISSYNNKLQFMLLVDKALIASQNEAQRVVDDIVKNLKLLNEERKHIERENKKEL